VAQAVLKDNIWNHFEPQLNAKNIGKWKKNAVKLYYSIYTLYSRHHEFLVGHVCWRHLFPSQFFTKLLLLRKQTSFGHRIETLEKADFLVFVDEFLTHWPFVWKLGDDMTSFSLLP
jgi:hypothetical protein